MTIRKEIFTEADVQRILKDLIGSIMFTDLGVTLFTYVNSDSSSRLISFLCTKGYISKSELDAFVHDKLILRARRIFDGMLKNNSVPDHLYHGGRILGYGIKYLFSNREIELINFETGETAEEYINKSEGLLELCVNQILSPPAPIQVFYSNDDCYESH